MARVVLKEENKIEDLELGDYVVLGDNILRQIVKVGTKYMPYNPESGVVYHPATSDTIEELIKEFDIDRIIKKDDMELREL